MDTSKTKKTRHYLAYTLLYISGPLFILLTNPDSLPLPLLVLPFLWLFAVLFVTLKTLIGRVREVRTRQATLIAGFGATLPVLLIVFQSIHQLSIRDVLLSLGLIGVVAVYMLRADFIK